MSKERFIILDRDGVINYDAVDHIKSPDEWMPIPGSLEAIARLTRSGYRVVVATNQSGLGQGLFDAATLNAIHAKMRRMTADSGGTIAGIFFCPHRPDDGCTCRKPQPGLLQQIAAHYAIPLHGVPVVGDARRDIQAARAVGARPVLVRTGKGRDTEAQLEDDQVAVFDDLAAATDALLAGKL